MMYKYGSSYLGTQPDSNRYVKMYRSNKLEFVCAQAIWNEGEVQFADVILPAQILRDGISVSGLVQLVMGMIGSDN